MNSSVLAVIYAIVLIVVAAGVGRWVSTLFTAHINSKWREQSSCVPEPYSLEHLLSIRETVRRIDQSVTELEESAIKPQERRRV
jgi:hypothetical protein